MKEFFKKIWTALCAVPARHLWACILGMLLCSLIGICAPVVAEWPIFPLWMLGGVAYGIAAAKGCEGAVRPFAWYCGGVLLIQLMLWTA